MMIQSFDINGNLITVGHTNKPQDPEAQALQLWKDWFEGSGYPWIDDDYGRTNCFFCVESEEDGHSADCVFIKAKTLLGIE